MPVTRPVRRAVTNENDENGTTRVTRAKAAAVDKPSDAAGVKKPLAATKSTATVQKRTALGDVSNVNKGDIGEAKEAKKPLALSKASQPIGIQKASRTNSTRVLGTKDKNTAVNELKRPASVTSDIGHVPKKRVTTSNSSRKSQSFKEEQDVDENAAPEDEGGVKVVTEITREIKTLADGRKVEKELKREERILDPRQVKRPTEYDEDIRMLDMDDYDDPLMVGEYVYEILDYMKELERSTAPNPQYMKDQGELDWRMRGVLVDWLLEVHTRFHLLPETFYLAINIVDRFLSAKFVHLERLQLVGVTAMFIASKYEEVLSPHIGNFAHVADDGFTEEEILSAERYILSTLNYDLSFPNPMHFMRRISKADNYDIQTRTLAKYLLEISLLDHRLLEFLPSVNAAASMYLARLILEKGEDGTWDKFLIHYSGYTQEEIRPAVQTMIDYLQRPVKHEAFYKKYAAKKFLKASLMARAWAKKYTDPLLEVRQESP